MKTEKERKKSTLYVCIFNTGLIIKAINIEENMKQKREFKAL